VSVLGDDLLGDPVKVHGMDLKALVHIADAHEVTLGGNDRCGGGKTLAVDRETQRPVVELHGGVEVDLLILRVGNDDAPSRPLGTCVSAMKWSGTCSSPCSAR
jgi:hypothetical protein